MKTKEEIKQRINEYKGYVNNHNITAEAIALYRMLIDELEWTIK